MRQHSPVFTVRRDVLGRGSIKAVSWAIKVAGQIKLSPAADLPSEGRQGTQHWLQLVQLSAQCFKSCQRQHDIVLDERGVPYPSHQFLKLAQSYICKSRPKTIQSECMDECLFCICYLANLSVFKFVRIYYFYLYVYFCVGATEIFLYVGAIRSQKMSHLLELKSRLRAT